MTAERGQNGLPIRRRLIAVALAALAAAETPAAAPAAAPVEEAQTVVAARPIRARALIEPADVTMRPGETPGALARAVEAVGMEARAAIYPGRAIRPGDVGPPALVERNAIVTMRFAAGPLEILAEGRSLGRAGLGEPVRVINLDSRTTVTGRVAGPNLIEVR